MQRKLLHILLTLSLLALLFTGCKKEDKSTQSEQTVDKVVTEKQLINAPRWVTADPSLRLRDSAGSEGNIIGNIPLGEEVTLLEESGDKLTIAGATGRWSRVKWQELEGWVFGGFLNKELPIEKMLIGEWEGRASDNGKEVERLVINIKINKDKSFIYNPYINEPELGKWKYLENNQLDMTYDNDSYKIIYKIITVSNNYLEIASTKKLKGKVNTRVLKLTKKCNIVQ